MTKVNCFRVRKTFLIRSKITEILTGGMGKIRLVKERLLRPFLLFFIVENDKRLIRP